MTDFFCYYQIHYNKENLKKKNQQRLHLFSKHLKTDKRYILDAKVHFKFQILL